MATIVTRAGKGSPLTHSEVDANFTNLNSDKIETSAIGSTVQAHSAVLDATTASFTTADETKLDGIEAGATADQTAAEILTAIKTVDGAGSGLDADTLDGIQASSFLQGNQTITLSGDATGSGTTSIVVTVADDSHNHIISNVDGLQTALDGKLDLSGGTMTGGLTFGAGVTLTEATDRADLLKITSSTSTWGGIQISNTSNEFLWSFMGDGTTGGIYDDLSNAWHIQFVDGGATTLYHANAAKIATSTTGVTVTGTAVADTFNATSTTNGGFQGIDADTAALPSFTWTSDLNTGVWHPAADQVGITTGGTNRLTVSNTGVSIANALTLNAEVVEKTYNLTGTALDPALGTIQYKTLSANTTFTDSLAAGESMTLMIDDGAARTITWPTMTWVNNAGSAPTLATSGYTVIALWKVSTTLYGALVGDGS